MYNTLTNGDSDDAALAGAELSRLHQAYMASIRQHRLLVGELCRTLSNLGTAIDSAALPAEARLALMAGIDRHVDQARGIVATIDTALTRATPAGSFVQH